ncbi:prenyltransferase/squalene oxidase repeat-containing protein [Lentzea sp. NPDC005914]|uniref:prenyltransferase/squalene oxidase repeat-containing protein n=1 Tax=Lentzea sp. NPDC005914 TaxID=3154572 RepID=UPI0033C13CD2
MPTCWTDHDDRAVADLVAAVCADPLGQVSPSVYETARLLASAPWLDGHAERLEFVLTAQNADGSWGAPDGYEFVPTLSAVEALSAVLRREEAADPEPVRRAVERGMAVLRQPRLSIPDTIAVELVVPWLAGSIGVDLPGNLDYRMLMGLRSRVRSGQPIPEKAWHSLEALGGDALRAAVVRPVNGIVCGSAAATAAWLGERTEHEAVAVLEHLQSLDKGAVRGISCINVFEPAWVVALLADAGLTVSGLTERLTAAVGPSGAPAGTGLPADSDDTAGVLYALAKLGAPGPVDVLWDYEGEDHFVCFPDEQTPSTSTNAHILDVFGAYYTGQPRIGAAIAKITSYLAFAQAANGSWWDKWHASPYYATLCCAQALFRTGGRSPMVSRAVEWVLNSQRLDGSWGRWSGTAEETAYSVLLLLLCAPENGRARQAASWAAGFLRATDEHPPLWHDKDLYTPIAVVRAARLAALRLISERAT